MPAKKYIRKKKKIVKRKIKKSQQNTVTTTKGSNSLDNDQLTILQQNPGLLTSPLNPYINPIRPGTNARELLISRMNLPLSLGAQDQRSFLSNGGIPLQSSGNINNERRLQDVRNEKQQEENRTSVIKEEIKKGIQELKEAKKTRKKAESNKEKQEASLEEARYDRDKAAVLDQKVNLLTKRITDLELEKEELKTTYAVKQGKEKENELKALISEEKMKIEETNRKIEENAAGNKVSALETQLEFIKAENEAKQAVLNSKAFTDSVETYKDRYQEVLKANFEGKLLDELNRRKEENALLNLRNNSSLTDEDYQELATSHNEALKNAELLTAQYNNQAYEHELRKSQWENLLENCKQAELRAQNAEIESVALSQQIDSYDSETEEAINDKMKTALETEAAKKAEIEKNKRLIESRRQTKHLLEEAYKAEQHLLKLPAEVSEEEQAELKSVAAARTALSLSKRKISYRTALLEQNTLSAEAELEYANLPQDLTAEETDFITKTAASKATIEKFNILKARSQEKRMADVNATELKAIYESMPPGASEEEKLLVAETAVLRSQQNLSQKQIKAAEENQNAELENTAETARLAAFQSEEHKAQNRAIAEYKKATVIADADTANKEALRAARKNLDDSLIIKKVHDDVYNIGGASAEENLAAQIIGLTKSLNELASNDKQVTYNHICSLVQGNPQLWQGFCQANPTIGHLNDENYLEKDIMYLQDYLARFIQYIADNPLDRIA